MIKFDCEKCGKLDYALQDGYAVGDRLLEQVMFQCRKNDDGTYDVVIDPSCAKYFSQLNEQMWLQRMKEYVETRADVFTCPNCGDDVVPDDAL